jgi:hypothetical protein
VIASLPNIVILQNAWKKVRTSEGFWAQLEGADFGRFIRSWMGSDLVIEMGFGLGRITHLEMGHSCRVHAIFWSTDAYKKLGEVALNASCLPMYDRSRDI